MIRVTIPMKNGAKIEIEGNLEYIKDSVESLPQVLDTLKTAIAEVQPITIENRIDVPVLQPTLSTDIPTINKTGVFSDDLLSLMDTPWGKQPRTLVEIEEALRTNGEYRAKSTVAATLLGAVQQGKLRRIRDSNKDNWKYIHP